MRQKKLYRGLVNTVLGKAVLMRSPPPGEEEIQKSAKDRKRKKETPAESPKPKRAKARKPRDDATVLTSAAAESLRAEGEDDDSCLLNKRTPDVGTPREGDDAFGDFFVGVEEDTDLNAPLILEEAAKLQKQVMMLYDQAFSKLRAELTHCEGEFEKLSSDSNELKARYAQREKELNSLRGGSEKMLQERANFVEQIKRRDALAAKDVEILELRRYKDSMALERDALRGELASTQSLLLGAKEEAHKFEALHAESAAALSSAANARAREISNKAVLKLARSLTYARLEARRQAFEEVHAKGFDLSAEIEEAKALEEESAALTTSDEGSSSSSESSGDEH
ncbi:PREDICTED: uncharacterized protein LOC109216025 [Nicotiana attenuata]|uniref:uncharacterized protein LOC109216025 n=1 Tax=Nicotiana attenuata TaxID=49451 RepID=UPI0009047F26|nr:PREDICTED: uncharacterized protein LOC109216025 [Nicotiana attenuata]